MTTETTTEPTVLVDLADTYPATTLIRVNDPEHGEGTLRVVAEPTETPGLVVTPRVSGGSFEGDWRVTHAASGLLVYGYGFEQPGNIHVARRVAKALGRVPLDWTADKDSVLEAYQREGVNKAIKDAFREGLYPEPESDGGKAPDGPAPYPEDESQATADAMARNLVDVAQHLDSETSPLINRRDDGRLIYAKHAQAFIYSYGLASVLRAFSRVDKQAADAAARKVWEAWDAGDTPSEQTWDWAREYGLPKPQERDLADHAPVPAQEG